MYTAKVVTSPKHCKIETFLLHTTKKNKKRYIDYQTAPFPMTLSDLQGHSPVASLFKWDFLYISCGSSQDFNWHRA